MLVALAGRLVRRPETYTILQTHLAVGNVQISTEAVTVFDKKLFGRTLYRSRHAICRVADMKWRLMQLNNYSMLRFMPCCKFISHYTTSELLWELWLDSVRWKVSLLWLNSFSFSFRTPYAKMYHLWNGPTPRFIVMDKSADGLVTPSQDLSLSLSLTSPTPSSMFRGFRVFIPMKRWLVSAYQ